MVKKKKEEPEEERLEIDFGIGKISFGGLFKGIGNLIDLVSKLSEEAKEIKKTGEIKGLGEKVKGVYGLSIRTLVSGEPVIETFGNIKETPKGPIVEEVREPIVDVIEEDGRILVIAELPGVTESDIHTEIKDDVLIIKASNEGREYAKEVLLPCPVDAEKMQWTYKNGILEIVLPKLGK